MAQWKPKASKEIYKYPKSVQKSIPIKAVHPHGIFEHNGEFTMSGTFTDINYQAASAEDQAFVFMGQQELIKALEIDEHAKLTVINWPVNENVLEKDLFIPYKNDRLDEYRTELNEINLKRATEGTNNIRQQRYFTVNTRRKKFEDAKVWFNRMENTLKGAFAKMGSEYTRLDTTERLKLFHDFFRSGEEQHFNLDIELSKRRGHSFKDYIAPDGMEFQNDHFRVGKRYGRVLVLKEYPAYLRDTLLSELMLLPKPMVLSVDYVSKSKEDSLQRVQAKLLSVDTEIANSTKNANRQGNYNATVPLRLDEKRRGLTDIVRLIKEYDQRIVFAQITLLHMADTIDELNHDTESIVSVGQRHMCQFAVYRNQQEAGLNTCLPYGLRYVNALRTLTTENAATFIPFVTKDLRDRGGMCIGINPISKNLVILDKLQAPSQNAWVLGITGSGKSMYLKAEILHLFLSTDDDIIWLDPEREAGPIIELLKDNASFIHLSAGSKHHINAMDMMQHCEAGDDPVSIKCEFMLTFFDRAIGSANMGAMEQTIVDRCCRRLLMKAEREHITVTLEDLYSMLLEQPEPEAHDLATCLELYVTGSLNSFAQPTNVNMDSRLICFDIRDLSDNGKAKPLGMLIVLDAIQNRVAYNRSRGKRTWVFCDEAWIMYREEYTAKFFDSWFRRLRKYGAGGEALCQTVSSLLASEYGRDSLSNSEFVIMFNQSASDRKQLAELLDISDAQLAYITNAESGTGLLRRSSVIVPFNGTFDRNTKLYKAMTTKIEEVVLIG